MSSSIDQVTEALAGTILEGRPIEVFDGPEGGEPSLVIACEADEAHAAWDVARAVVGTTGRWPILADFLEPDFVSNRFSFRIDDPARAALPRSERPPIRCRSVDDVLGEASTLSAAEAEAATRSWLDREEADVEQALTATRDVVGSAPTAVEVEAALGADPSATVLDRWLLSWEEGHRTEPIEVGYVDPVDLGIDCDHVVLLPTAVSWEALAHVGFFGAEGEQAARFVALARDWYERFGAEVRSIWGNGTWMDFVVARPPQDLDAAFEVAAQQLLVGWDTFDHLDPFSYTVRGLARALVGSPTWALAARP